jgi:hypothetical protein
MVQRTDASDTDTFRRYIEGHLAGAAVGHAVATRLAETHRGTDIGTTMDTLVEEIEEERAIVQSAIERLPAKPDLMRRAAKMVGGATAKAAALPFVPEPSLLEDLEALAVGIWGKRLLWGALRRADLPEGDFSDLPLDHLAEKAEHQEREVLRLREDLLVSAFPTDS